MKIEFKKIELSEGMKALNLELPNVNNSFINEIIQQQLKCEENCIKQVIEQYTGKPLEMHNSSKVQRAFYLNDFSKYILSYDGVHLGMVRYINDGCIFRVEFTPNEINF